MDVGANAEVDPTKRKETMELLKRTIVYGVCVMMIQFGGYVPMKIMKDSKHADGAFAVPPPAFDR